MMLSGRRLRLGPVHVTFELSRYRYDHLGLSASRWVLRPTLVVDRAFGGGGTSPRSRAAKSVWKDGR